MAIAKIAPIQLAQKSLPIIDGAIATTDGLYRVETISLRQVKELIAASAPQAFIDCDLTLDVMSHHLGPELSQFLVSPCHHSWFQSIGETVLAFTLLPIEGDGFDVAAHRRPATWQLITRLE